MANPKRRTSKARRNRRRSHDALNRPAASTCPQCGDAKLPHRACPTCGHYHGREAVQVEDAL